MTQRLRINAAGIVVLAIVAAAVVTLIIQCLNPEGLGDWLRTLSATAISALFAVAIGIGLFNWQNKVTDRRKTHQLLRLLAAEMNETKQALDELATTIEIGQGREKRTVMTHIEPLITEEAAKSGLLGAPEDIAHNAFLLVRTARYMRAYNDAVRALSEALLVGEERQVCLRIKNVNSYRELVIQGCDYILYWLREQNIPTDPPPQSIERSQDSAESA